jgi:hypothetical protein
MTRRILFKYDHLDLLNLQEDYRPLLDLEGIRFVLKQLPLPNADGLTLMVDDQIMCCFGYLQLFSGVSEVWLFPSVNMGDYGVTVVREVKGYLEATAEVRGWHRVQTLTRNIRMHRKWMEVLGFVEEGTLKQYYQKEDYILSARYFDWSKA